MDGTFTYCLDGARYAAAREFFPILSEARLAPQIISRTGNFSVGAACFLAVRSDQAHVRQPTEALSIPSRPCRGQLESRQCWPSNRRGPYLVTVIGLADEAPLSQLRTC